MPRSELETEFLADHKKMTRAFRDLIDAVNVNDVEQFRGIANQLNAIAGPHIAFEESVLYPRVDQNSSKAVSSKLCDEHDTARSAIGRLIQQSGPLTDEDRKLVVEQLQVGFKHAVACGSLLSHLTVATNQEQQQMLAELKEFRRQKRLWTDIGNGQCVIRPDQNSVDMP